MSTEKNLVTEKVDRKVVLFQNNVANRVIKLLYSQLPQTFLTLNLMNSNALSLHSFDNDFLKKGRKRLRVVVFIFLMSHIFGQADQKSIRYNYFNLTNRTLLKKVSYYTDVKSGQV